MKKNMLFLILFAGSALLFSCKKDSPATSTATDARDKFVGTWSGSHNERVPDLSIDETSQSSFTIVKHPINSNQIIIDDTQIANVNGNSYTYVQFNITETDPSTGLDILATYNGTGTLNGTNLVESGTMSILSVGTTFNGTWSSNLVKQ